jgi:uncharacterized protein (TIGR03437 family)
VYAGGSTLSTDFPTLNAYQSKYGGAASDNAQPVIKTGDGFVAKFDTTGKLVYSTYLGGSGDDAVMAIAADAAGAAYVTGFTTSSNFPVSSSAAQRNFTGPAGVSGIKGFAWGDAFVAKLAPSGSSLVWATYLGGNDDDAGMAIAVDAGGNAIVGGFANSTNLKVTSDAQQKTFGGTNGPPNFSDPSGDAFLAKVSSDGASFLYLSYYGGNASDAITALALDGQGNVIVGGTTTSTNLPITANAAQKAFGGEDPQFETETMGDAFVAKFQLDAGPQITLAGIGNAANYVAGKVSPGEIIVVYGYNFGPAALAQLQYVNGIATTTLGSTSIYFDNVAAPMIYAVAGSPGVLSCVVPYAVKTSTQVQVAYNGVKGNALTVPVVDSVPGIFSLNQSGTGPGAILNWPDYTVNGSSNRVAASGYIMAYATGEGETDIASDGQHVPLLGPYPKPLLAPWTATVGGKPASVTYSGSAPDNIAGVFQVNVQIPSDLTTGVYDLVIITGTFTSTAGLTVAVK